MIRTVSIRGKKWKLADRPMKGTVGHCDPPTGNWKTMFIPLDGDTCFDLDTIIHECLHAGAWDLAEEAVDEIARDTARVLWRLGWRKDD